MCVLIGRQVCLSESIVKFQILAYCREILPKSNSALFRVTQPHLNSQGVGRILENYAAFDCISGLQNCLEFSLPPLCFTEARQCLNVRDEGGWGYCSNDSLRYVICSWYWINLSLFFQPLDNLNTKSSFTVNDAFGPEKK